MTAERRIVDPKRDKSGLFVQPKDFSPEREVVENHNRDRFAAHFKYADPFTGNTRTFDEEGDYNCGRCNQFVTDGRGCLLLDVDSVDPDTGSCGDWEVTCAGDPEMVLHLKSPEVASYAVAVDGWGCHRCPFASKAYQEDSRGRDLYCGKMDARVFANACCAINGAETKEDDGSVEYDDSNDSTATPTTSAADKVVEALLRKKRKKK